MRRLQDIYTRYDWFLIIPEEESHTFAGGDGERVYTIPDINEGRWKNPLRLLRALWATMRIFRREDPAAVVSTGAGIAIPAFLLARLGGRRTLFIETFARIRRPSMSGKVCYRLADRFLVQHEALLAFYPRARFLGALYENM